MELIVHIYEHTLGKLGTINSITVGQIHIGNVNIIIEGRMKRK